MFWHTMFGRRPHWQRWPLIAVVVLALVAAPASQTGASFDGNEGFGQLYGMKQLINPVGCCYYTGSQSYQTTPAPAISSGWAAAPTGLTNSRHPDAYVESGPIKDCNRGCAMHPYASYRATYGASGFFEDETAYFNGDPNTFFLYQSAFDPYSGAWNIYYCGASCVNLMRVGTGTGDFPFVGAGGEASCVGCPLGFSRHAQNSALTANGWGRWCYGFTQFNFSGGSISSCNSDNTFDTNYR